jgi:hypothetical protein
MAGTNPPAFAKSMFTDSTCLPPKIKSPKPNLQNLSPEKQKTRWGFLRQRADECFVLRNSMHTSSDAAWGCDDGGDASESSH